MRASDLERALENLGKALRDVEAALEDMRSQRDPLGLHIFVSRRHYRNLEDFSKNGHHRERQIHGSFRIACDLGFAGSLGEWERLLGATPKR